jgi:hypothetical protein
LVTSLFNLLSNPVEEDVDVEGFLAGGGTGLANSKPDVNEVLSTATVAGRFTEEDKEELLGRPDCVSPAEATLREVLFAGTLN